MAVGQERNPDLMVWINFLSLASLDNLRLTREKGGNIMLMELTVLPVGGNCSMGPMVAKAIDLIDKSGLPYHVGAMGTVVEGKWEELMKLAHSCHQIERECSDRVFTSIKIDDREGAENMLEKKVKSIEEILHRPLK
jgi:uncharacterized protein (TIGR00106 family)